MESPLLYLFFVGNLINHLDSVHLDFDSPSLGGKKIRALQFADDVALIAKSPEDLNALLDSWASFCDSNHFITQIRKTEIVPFSACDLTSETDLEW